MVKKFVISFSSICLFFIGLSRLFGIGGTSLEKVSSLLVYPVLVMGKAIRSPFLQWNEHNRSVHEVLTDLEASSAARDDLQKEVLELRALLNYKECTKDMREFLTRYSPETCLVAQVLLKQFGSSHFYLIDAGSKRGVSEDMIAVFKDCLLGRVVEVYPWYSKVLLITDPGCKVAAVCSQTGVKAIHEGAKQLDVTQLTYVGVLDELKENDMVLSSGEGMIFPKGFGLGRIKHIEHDGYTARVAVTPLLDLRTINYCCLIEQLTELKEQPPDEESFVPIAQKAS